MVHCDDNEIATRLLASALLLVESHPADQGVDLWLELGQIACIAFAGYDAWPACLTHHIAR